MNDASKLTKNKKKEGRGLVHSPGVIAGRRVLTQTGGREGSRGKGMGRESETGGGQVALRNFRLVGLEYVEQAEGAWGGAEGGGCRGCGLVSKGCLFKLCQVMSRKWELTEGRHGN